MKKSLIIIAAVAVLGILVATQLPIESTGKKSVASTSSTQQESGDSNNPAASTTQSQSTQSTTNSSQSSTSSNSSSTSYKDGTYKGSVSSNRFGDVQVQITISGGKVTSAKALSYPDEDNHSVRINQQAIPMLNEQAISAQNADLDGVSGATITTESYIESLQAALDAART